MGLIIYLSCPLWDFCLFSFWHRVAFLYFCWTGAGFGLSRYAQSILLLLWVKILNCLVNTCLLQRNASLPGCLILKPCSHEICWESTNSCDYLTALGNGTETRSVFEIKSADCRWRLQADLWNFSATFGLSDAPKERMPCQSASMSNSNLIPLFCPAESLALLS